MSKSEDALLATPYNSLFIAGGKWMDKYIKERRLADRLAKALAKYTTFDFKARLAFIAYSRSRKVS